jgi:hypothetical protein
MKPTFQEVNGVQDLSDESMFEYPGLTAEGNLLQHT